MPFRLEGGVRLAEGPAHVAIREALVNLLTHADYAETQASLILHAPDGYTFRNPGSSRVSEYDLLTGDRSDPRNPELARMFRLAGLAEEAGTGIPQILQAWRELGFHLPAIDPGTERYEFTLALRHAHLLSEDDRVWLQSFGRSWNESEQLALVQVRREGWVDNETLRRLTGQHPADVTKVLGSLRDLGLLQMVGWGRGARYHLASDATAEQPATVQPPGSRGPALGLAPSVGNSTSLGKSSTSSDQSSTALEQELAQLARRMQERRHVGAQERNAVILALCARAPLSTRDLMRLLKRSAASVHAAIGELLASGQLAYLYPERANHPQQRYVTVQPRPESKAEAAPAGAPHVAERIDDRNTE